MSDTLPAGLGLGLVAVASGVFWCCLVGVAGTAAALTHLQQKALVIARGDETGHPAPDRTELGVAFIVNAVLALSSAVAMFCLAFGPTLRFTTTPAFEAVALKLVHMLNVWPIAMLVGIAPFASVPSAVLRGDGGASALSSLRSFARSLPTSLGLVGAAVGVLLVATNQRVGNIGLPMAWVVVIWLSAAGVAHQLVREGQARAQHLRPLVVGALGLATMGVASELVIRSIESFGRPGPEPSLQLFPRVGGAALVALTVLVAHAVRELRRAEATYASPTSRFEGQLRYADDALPRVAAGAMTIDAAFELVSPHGRVVLPPGRYPLPPAFDPSWLAPESTLSVLGDFARTVTGGYREDTVPLPAQFTLDAPTWPDARTRILEAATRRIAAVLAALAYAIALVVAGVGLVGVFHAVMSV